MYLVKVVFNTSATTRVDMRWTSIPSLLGDQCPLASCVRTSSWPSEESLPSGTPLLLPVYRSTTPIPAGMQLLVPGYLPSTPLPAGEWIYLPARRSASVLEELPA